MQVKELNAHHQVNLKQKKDKLYLQLGNMNKYTCEAETKRLKAHTERNTAVKRFKRNSLYENIAKNQKAS